MSVVTRCLVFSLVCFFLLVSAPYSSAAVVTVDTSAGAGQVGAFYGLYTPADDAPLSYPPTIPPDNDPTFQNYFLGRTTSTPVSTGFTTPERRAFFFFDMAGIAASIPAGDEITDVTIDLELLPGGTSALANFTGDVEIVDFSSTIFTPAEILDPDLFAIPPDAIWSSFGTSTPYGGFGIDGPGSATPADTYSISLPGSIPDLGSTIGAGDIFIVTARLVTFDPGPIGALAPPAIDPYEYVFGLTDVVSSSGSTTAAPVLTITTAAAVVPEPSSAVLLVGLMALGLCGRRVF